MKDLRYLLENGVFGRMNNGDKFVVVNDKILYQKGGWDRVSDCKYDLSYTWYKIDYLIEGYSFDSIDTYIGESKEINIIYDRSGKYGVTKTTVEMTIEEIEEKLGITNLKIIGGNN